ncbi:MAG: tetratricopeptide repeat protein [Candidatus Marinimicrobia bacterium]|nr:tetratricopeptide repeat protein [Candidatus Neomarinimicrobiota bacterium]
MRNFHISGLSNTHHAVAQLISLIALAILISLPGFGQSSSNRSTPTDIQRHNQLQSVLEEIKTRFKSDSSSAGQSLDSLIGVLHGDEPNLAYVNYYRGMFYAAHRDQDRAGSFQTQALALAQKSENDQLTGKILIELGKLESGLGNNPGAIEYYLSAIEPLGRVGDHRSLGSCYSLLGNIYRILGEYDKAINYITEAETEYSQIGFSEGKAWVEYSLANIYKDLDLYEEALEYFYKSLDVYVKAVNRPGDSLGVAICLDQIGEIYFDQNLFQKAREFVLRSYKIHKQANDGHGIAISLKNLGKIEYKLNNYEKALEFLHQARTLKQEGKDVLVLSQIYEYMGRALFNLGQQQAGIDTAKNRTETGI